VANAETNVPWLALCEAVVRALTFHPDLMPLQNVVLQAISLVGEKPALGLDVINQCLRRGLLELVLQAPDGTMSFRRRIASTESSALRLSTPQKVFASSLASPGCTSSGASVSPSRPPLQVSQRRRLSSHRRQQSRNSPRPHRPRKSRPSRRSRLPSPRQHESRQQKTWSGKNCFSCRKSPSWKSQENGNRTKCRRGSRAQRRSIFKSPGRRKAPMRVGCTTT
jgi:hypothetical protein